MRVLIVDDEKLARDRLRELLNEIGGHVVVGEGMNGNEAVEKAAELNPDVVLMDIRMPGMDGLEAAMHLMGMENPPMVIFTTAYDQHALHAFEVNAVDYLLKPIRLARLFEALSRVRSVTPLRLDVLRELKREPRTHLSVNERGRVHLIPVADIAYLKAELKYVTARTAEREFLVEESLAKLEQEFLGRFVRVHRNCLVAREAIEGFERATGDDGEGHWVVVMKNIAEKLPVSRRQQHIVREIGILL